MSKNKYYPYCKRCGGFNLFPLGTTKEQDYYDADEWTYTEKFLCGDCSHETYFKWELKEEDNE